MKKLVILMAILSVMFFATKSTMADVILYENFDDSSGFTIGGAQHYWIQWGVEPLSGTINVPSSYIQGGSQEGNIFYGSFGKGYSGEASPYMTIALPDLTGFTDIQFDVSIAAPYGIWETTHRDSLIITGSTGLIDSFLPAWYGGPLRSHESQVNLNYQFKDFNYNIDSDLTYITFTFGSTDYNETIGIDSVKISGTPSTPGVVPEPASLLLMGLGVAGMAAKKKLWS